MFVIGQLAGDIDAYSQNLRIGRRRDQRNGTPFELPLLSQIQQMGSVIRFATTALTANAESKQPKVQNVE